jgi:ketosteroid isomerase-like protein
MIQTISIALAIATFAAAQGCAPAVKPGNGVERELRALDQAWADLAVRGDVAAFDRLVTDDHIATHANGRLVTNAEEKAYIVKSPEYMASITTDEVGIRVYGDTAIIRGRVTVKTKKGGGGAYRYTTVWLNRNERWRIVAEQHTKIEPTPPPAATSPSAIAAEQVVRAYVKACNELDLPAFVALHSPDVRKFTRSDESGNDAGSPSPGSFAMTTSGRDEVERKYKRAFAATPRSVRVEVVGLFALGDLVVSRDRVSGFPDGHVAEELSLYQVRDGLIQNIWYLEQIKH